MALINDIGRPPSPYQAAGPSSGQDGDTKVLQPRAYQLEMLEDSIRRNIIVVMDTGSGKTQIAVLRMEAELERCKPDKRVWFLCTTVALAEQQHLAISTQLPSYAYQARVLSGGDGVDRWSEQRMWDDVLDKIRIVVCTPQVLLDALIHGFVAIRQIALLVFDEAHHCNLNHPYRRIMQDYYYPCLRSEDLEAPTILGLTASPVINKKQNGLQIIEQNMNAISRSPKVNREELLSYVHHPSLRPVFYRQSDPNGMSSRALHSLEQVYAGLNFEQDPYVVKLRSSNTVNAIKTLQQVRLNRKTYCQDHFKRFLSMSADINHELGSWAADYYIYTCVQRFLAYRWDDLNISDALQEQEKSYLRKAFERVELLATESPFLPGDPRLTPKVHQLIDILMKDIGSDSAGLVFVRTRASVTVLAHLLSSYPIIRHKISVGTFVGTSSSDKRKRNIGDLVDIREQAETLNDLRYRKKNLIIATSVLEEGIDVSACNVVICFEKPPNLKSFIQRRGRARKSSSKYIIMFEEDQGSSSTKTWQELEEAMKQVYLDDMRQLEEIRELEEDEHGYRNFVVESTGAKLTLHDAIQHLYHFCSKLIATQYADLRPLFTFEEDDSGCFRGRVLLPKCVDASVREAYSSTWWKTEKFAKRDAAFEAYVALHHAGLLNDHLLPLLEYDEAAAEAAMALQKRESLVSVAENFNPWQEVAIRWQAEEEIHESIVSLCLSGKKSFHMRLVSPMSLPRIPSFEIYWNAYNTYRVDIGHAPQPPYRARELAMAGRATELILSSIHKPRMEPERLDFPLLFVPMRDGEDLQTWVDKARGTSDVYHLADTTECPEDIGLIRDMTRNGIPHVFHRLHPKPQDLIPDVLENGHIMEEPFYLEVSRLPKRTDYLHQVPPDVRQSSTGSSYVYLPASKTQVDNLPFAYSQFAMFIPSIMHHIEVSLIAQHLCEGLLSRLHIQDRSLVTTAISASVAREVTNYQRLEFLGDSCLKLYTSINLMAEHLKWHEGYLTGKKSYIVSNARLAVAAKETGLDRYILTKPFTGYRWKSLYNAGLLEPQPPRTRELSSKTLADVVEAIIGAAFLDGGAEKVIVCLSIFLPDIRWLSLSERHQTLSAAISPDVRFPPQFTHLETLIGHTFSTKALLLEAVTHASHLGRNTAPSYERLEFLGDSVLDSIITSTLFGHSPLLPHQTMHLCRTALVNANFLAFFCMNLSISTPRTEPIEDKATGESSTIDTTVLLSIWQFMRHSTYDIALAQQRCLSRFHDCRTAIRHALDAGDSYPWLLLSQLDADKFFSDMIESILGAIYIDTSGSLPACQTFLDKLGVAAYLERLVGGNVRLRHPKEELGIVAGHETVRYEAWVEEEGAGEQIERGKVIAAKVWVGEREAAKYHGAKSRIEAETGAAEEAVRILKAAYPQDMAPTRAAE